MDLISIEDGFQYSVNIAYDLHDDKKLKSFIPTKSSLKLIEDILLSTKVDSTDRARVLVGAYGKGKSHIVLSILSLLSGTSIHKFEKLEKKIENNEKLKVLIQNYEQNKTKLLPVLITGTGTSISQNFLQALQRTLSENNLLGLMPETNFKAAIKTIERWRSDYPETVTQFKKEIDENLDKFISRLSEFEIEAYKKFEEVYPKLTSGSSFNPFISFDVIDIYESVIKSLKDETPYSGIFVVYDEFSKYLETNIASTSVSDTKMLQDFAEKCNRSANNQLHLMLICHKEISNYIDTLPKQKVDGWRGISERFTHVHLNNNSTQTYEIIESVIIKNPAIWQRFILDNDSKIEELVKTYKSDNTFNDINEEDLRKIFIGCYPLHPSSIYILPRLSERVAQNERTLFTFLSSPASGGLISYLMNTTNIKDYILLTPDILYDYFEPLFKKEIYTEDLYKTYTLTSVLLDKLDTASLEAKIVKTLSLIYILGQFERLEPTSTTIHLIYKNLYLPTQIDTALSNLIEKECIVYLKRSNNYYSLKQSSGIDIQASIEKIKKENDSTFSLKNILSNINFEKALYPLGYNDAKEMTRYFSFVFIDEDEIKEDVNWEKKIERIKGDGVIFAVLLKKNSSLKNIQEEIKKSKDSSGRCVFILPKESIDIVDYAKEYQAAKALLAEVGEDQLLRDEYEVIIDDLQELLNEFISIYTHSENGKSIYLYKGEKVEIKRKADITTLLSNICNEYYANTPVIINESINKDSISSAATNARSKILSGLLKKRLEKNLGLTGGQELAVMRSLLINTGIIELDCDDPKINLFPNDKNLVFVLELIRNYIIKAKDSKKSFSELYKQLTSAQNKIGIRKGVIPVYLACVFHEYQKQIILYSKTTEIPLTIEVLSEINENPDNYSIGFMDWSNQEDIYIEDLSKIFANYIIDNEKSTNTYDYVFNAMRRWYMNLPKYTKEMKSSFDGNKVPEQYGTFLKKLKQVSSSQDFLFVQLRKIFLNTNEILKAKQYFDSNLNSAISLLKLQILNLFGIENNASDVSLYNVLNEWSFKLNEKVCNTVFSDGTSRFIKLCKNENDSDSYFIKQIALLSTDLNIEDWNDSTIESAISNIKKYKSTAENENNNNVDDGEVLDSKSYEIKFVSSTGVSKSTRFEKDIVGPKANMLSRSLKSTIEGMGLSVTDSEKRQVLMNLLLEICGGEE